MNFDEVKSILNTLNNRQQELGKLLLLENKTKDNTSYLMGIESLQLEFSKSEVAKILDEKKKSIEDEIRELAKELSEVEE